MTAANDSDDSDLPEEEDDDDLEPDECTMFALALLARESGATDPDQLMELAESGALQREFASLTRKLPPADAAKLLAYRARMEEDPDEADELIKAALSLDTECIEARVIEAAQFAEDPAESVRRLRDAVELARRPFLSTDTGIVRDTMRGLHEATRRRALLALAAAEQAADSFADAARTYQEFERTIDAGDPEGSKIRTLRLACALAAGDLTQARELLTTDDREEQERRLWGLVLERFLADDQSGARTALVRARAAAPDAEPLLRGDLDLEGYFMAAELSPDTIATAILLAAWERNDGAQEWLGSQKRPR